MADEGQIIQVVSNIILNAIQAMPGGGTIHISAENLPSSPPLITGERHKVDEFVKVSIRDEGAGIPPHLLSKIFEPYFTTKKDGHGLGLAAAHSIIKNHGGFLQADSETGKGTTFVILLPAVPGINNRAELHAGTGAVRKSGHVLVMEDEAAIAIILKEMLERLGCTVETAGDGQEAVRVYADGMDGGRPFDLVITGLKIGGGMGGAEAVAMIKEFDPGVKAVALSRRFDEPVASDYEKYGFRGLLDIPFTMEKLARILDRML
jgi:CheY-like chemotaxis protein